MKSLSCLVLLVLGSCLSGCIGWKQAGSSEMGFKQATTWSFYQQTEKKVPEEESSFDVFVMPVLDWVSSFFKKDADVETEGTTVDP